MLLSELNLVVVTWNSIHLLSHAMELNPVVVTYYGTQSICCHMLWNSIHLLSHAMELNPFVVTYYGTQSICCHIPWNSIHLLSHAMELNPFVITYYGTQSICCHMLWNSIQLLSHTMEHNPFVVTYYGIQSTCCHILWNSIHFIVMKWDCNPPYCLHVESQSIHVKDSKQLERHSEGTNKCDIIRSGVIWFFTRTYCIHGLANSVHKLIHPLEFNKLSRKPCAQWWWLLTQ